MITISDIDHLAKLSRMDISESEKQKIASEIESILGYVKQVSDTKNSISENFFENINSLRDDVVTNIGDSFSEDLLNLAPTKEGRYFKVKKILE